MATCLDHITDPDTKRRIVSEANAMRKGNPDITLNEAWLEVGESMLAEYESALQEAVAHVTAKHEERNQRLGKTKPVAQKPETTPEPEAKQGGTVAKTAAKKANIVSDNDDLLAAIAKLGGLNRDEAKAQGIDPKAFGTRGYGIKRVFTKAGRSYDEMAELLRGYHFDVPMANDLVESVSRAINQGEKIYNPAGYERISELKAQERYDDEQAQVHAQLEDAIESGDITVDDLQGALDNDLEFMDEYMDDLGIKETFTGQDAIKALNDYFGIDDEQATTEASAGESGQEALQGYTEQELAERADAEKRRLKQEESDRVKAEQKAKVDGERDSLVDEMLGTAPKTNDVFGMSDPLENINKPEVSVKPEPKPNEAQRKAAEKLRKVAQSTLDKAIEEQNRDRATHTPRMARMASGALENAQKDEALAKTMLNLADAIESGEAKALAGIKSKSQVELLNTLINLSMYAHDRKKNLSYAETERQKGRPATEEDIKFIEWPEANIHESNFLSFREKLKAKRGGVSLAASIKGYTITPEQYQKIKQVMGDKEAADAVGWWPVEALAQQARLKSAGINNLKELKQAAKEFLQYKEGAKKVDPIKAAEMALVGQNVGVDFFPTPKSLASRMADMAGIKEGMRVLEPSAGNGNLADAAKANGATVEVIEISPALRDVLDAKGYNIVAHDFADFKPAELYDAIIMNPPFSNGQDAEHIQKAYDMLKPGGKLVAIAGEGIFFRSDKKSSAFREWIDERAADVEKLPAGTFQDKTLLNTTGVNARLIEITKPTDAKFSKTAPPKSGSTVEEIKSLLPRRVKRLVESGKLIVVQSIDDLPAHLKQKGTALGESILWGVESSLDKNSVDSIVSNAHSVGDFVKSGPILTKAFSLLDTPTKSIVLDRVFDLAQDDKIRNAVIKFIPVDVMNLLRAKKLPADMLFNDPSVFKDAFTSKTSSQVSAIIDPAASALIRSVALNTAKIYGLDMTSFPVKAGAAMRTIDAIAHPKNRTTSVGAKEQAAFVSGNIGFTSRDRSVTSGTLDNRHDVTPNSNVVLDKADALTSVLSPIISQADRNLSYSVAAWHGSPHDHNKFDSSKIGTGEGAQAFGYGHYFTDKKEIAEWYKNALGEGSSIVKNGRNDYSVITPSGDVIAENVLYGNAVRIKEEWDQKNKGKLYQVELAPTEDEYLDWDKPLSEQSEKVKRILEESELSRITINLRDRDNYDISPDMTYSGGEFYRRLADGYPADASNTLHKLGIRGIRYPAEGGKSDAYNYVIFSDDDISITAKYSQNLSGVEALYDGNRDEMYLVADMLNRDNLMPVLNHELYHRLEATDPNLKAAIARFDGDLQRRFNLAAKGFGSSIEKAAYNRVIKAGTPQVDKLEEFKAYIVSEYSRAPESFTGVIKKIIQDFIAAIRAAMLRVGIPLRQLTPADLNALAMYGARVHNDSMRNSKSIMRSAKAAGYEGSDPAEAEEWIRAKEKGLDMSKRARMERAKEMGFKTKVWHHATVSDVNFDREGFDTGRGDLGAHFGNINQAFHVLENRNQAQGRIIDVLLALNNPIRLKDVGSFHADGIAVQLEKKGLLTKGEGKRIEKEIDKNWRLRKEYDPYLIRVLKDAGYDGVIYKNTHEGDGDSVIVFDANKIRSIHAAFDPDYADSPNLLASVSPNSDNIPETITIDGKERPTRNSNGQLIHPTEEGIRNFWKWFGDSRVTDENGRPLLVYHGTASTEIERFLPDGGDVEEGKKSLDNFRNAKEKNEPFGYMNFRSGTFFSPDPSYADHYAAEGKGVIYPAYIHSENPVWQDAITRKVSGVNSRKTPDAFMLKDGDKILEVAVIDPNKIKSAIGNTGSFDPNSDNIRFSRSQAGNSDNAEISPNSDNISPNTDNIKFSRSSFGDLQAKAQTAIADHLTSHKTFNWWHNTVGTQYHKAFVDKDFGKVFHKSMAFEQDMARMANETADLAPSLLPKLDDNPLNAVAEIPRGYQRNRDAKQVADAIFQTTLNDRRMNDDELQALGYDDTQRQMYREFFAAVNHSLDELAKSEMFRSARSLKLVTAPETLDVTATGRFYYDQITDPVADQINEVTRLWQEKRDEINKLRAAGRRKDMRYIKPYIDEEAQAHANQIREEYNAKLKPLLEELNSYKQERKAFVQKAAHIEKMQRQGYAPLMRFGQYTVDVVEVDPYTQVDGERLFFGMFETEAEANKIARAMREEYPEARVDQGILSQNDWQMFKGITPETVEVFSRMLGVSADEAFQKYLTTAINNRSALKRLIHRKKIAGYAMDPQRVLASFITSNARAASKNKHLGEMIDAITSIPKHKGDVIDEAVDLYNYVQNPAASGAAIRSMLFTWYLGGSVASALVNLTQTFTTTFPYLHQYGVTLDGIGKAMKQAANIKALGGDLGKALKRAEEEGVVAPHELHMLYGEAMRSGTLGPDWLRPLGKAWGSLFSLAETYNRRVAFIAAYTQAKADNKADPFQFASDAVEQTQFVYSKSSRPNWARSTLGSALFTFKTFTINYLEFLKRLPPKERALALGVLVLFAGLGGLPGEDDADDIIDTVGQAMGYNTNVELAKERIVSEFFKDLLGDKDGEIAKELALRGISGVLPFDVSGRLGVGNIIPGTALLKKSETNKSRDVMEFAGPAGSLASRVVEAFTEAQGREGAMNMATMLGKTVMPKALQDAYQAFDMYQTGQYRDYKGRKVRDVTMQDWMSKAIGLQPSSVAERRRGERLLNQSITMAKVVETDIADLWAEGIYEKDRDKVKEAQSLLAKWNDRNPETPIRIGRGQIDRRLKQMRMTSGERLFKTTPREMRRYAQDTLNE